jgi:hypothetical protein
MPKQIFSSVMLVGTNVCRKFEILLKKLPSGQLSKTCCNLTMSHLSAKLPPKTSSE